MAEALIYLPGCEPNYSNNKIITMDKKVFVGDCIIDGVDDNGFYCDDEDIAAGQTMEPIKKLEDISRMYDYFMSRNKFRDAVMFTVAINIGLRVSDLLELKFGTFYRADWSKKIQTYIIEQKTKNTKGRSKNFFNADKFYREHADLPEEEQLRLFMLKAKEARNTYIKNTEKKYVKRYIKVNDLIYEALDAYRNSLFKEPQMSDYLFRDESRNCTTENKPLSRKSAWNIFEKASKDLNLGIKLGTHGLRKTFGYHMMSINNNSHEALYTLQKIFGHSSPEVTLRYIGITRENIDRAYDDVGKHFGEVIVYPSIGKWQIQAG